MIVHEQQNERGEMVQYIVTPQTLTLSDIIAFALRSGTLDK